jgi:hypothetical protein
LFHRARGQRDDATPRVCRHARQHTVREFEHAAQYAAISGIPIFERHLGKCAGLGTAAVEHEDLDTAEGVIDGL